MENNGVKDKYPKNPMINRRRKSALSRLEIRLEELKKAKKTFLNESKEKQSHISDNQELIKMANNCDISINRIEKEIETLKSRIY